MANTKTFDQQVKSGRNNTNRYRELKSLVRKHTIFYWAATIASVSISFTGYLVTKEPLFLALIMLAESGKWLLYPSKRTEAKIVLPVLMLISIVSGAIGMSASKYTLEVEYEKDEILINKQNDRIEFLRAELNKNSEVKLNLSQFEVVGASDLDHQLYIYQTKWFKYRHMSMRDWTANNKNGRKGSRSGQWMIDNRSKCITYWCRKIIRIYDNYQKLVIKASRIQRIQHSKRKYIAVFTKNAESARNDRKAMINQLSSLELQLNKRIEVSSSKPFFNSTTVFVIMIGILILVEFFQWHTNAVRSDNMTEWKQCKFDYKEYHKSLKNDNRVARKSAKEPKPIVKKKLKALTMSDAIHIKGIWLKSEGQTKIEALNILSKHGFGKSQKNFNLVRDAKG